MEYYIDPTTRFLHEVTKCPGMNPAMPILEAIFNPMSTRLDVFRDCILISLDTEYDSNTHEISQIGIASLDTRVIAKADDPDLAPKTLSSRLMLLRPMRLRRGLYLYGQPEKCYDQSLKDPLRPVFEVPDTRNKTGLRNIILVGHGIKNDIHEIKRSSGYSIMSLPAIKTVIDTSPIVNSVFNTTVHCHSLRQTCTILGMYRRNLHVAGNDAMYTLKALLLLYSHYKEEKLFFEDGSSSADWALLHQCHLEAIRRIGRCNNGKSRIQKKLEKKPRRKQGLKREDACESDVLAIEDGNLDRLFLQ